MTHDCYTKHPNFLYDLMPEMTEAETKVVWVIVRQTIGWQRERCSLTIEQLMALTGLSKPSVVSGIKAATEHKILGRQRTAEGFDYWITEPTDDDAKVKNFNFQDEDESKESELSTVKNLNYQTVKNFNPNKRNINTNKPDKEIPDSDAYASAHADAAPAMIPATQIFRNFHDELQTAEPKGRTPILRRAYVFCFGEESAPDHGRIGAFAKRVGGAGMALELMWQFLSRPPNGNVLDYLEATHKARQNDRRKPYSKKEQPDADTDRRKQYSQYNSY